MKNYHQRLHNGRKFACGGNDKEGTFTINEKLKIKVSPWMKY
jgi:hypothetical protein